MHCPWCHDVFYGYQAEGEEKQPFQIEAQRPMVPLPGFKGLFRPDSQRQTCGGELCEKAAEGEFLARHGSYQRCVAGEVESEPQEEPTKPRGGMRRAGQ